MALKLVKTYPNGVTVEHWRLSELHYDFESKNTVITLTGFLTRAAKQAGATPFCSEQAMVDGPFTPANIATIRDKCYVSVKALPQWAESIDSED